MGLTYKQAKDYLPPEYAALHPAASGGKSKERELLDRLDAASKPKSKAPDDGMNKTERAFWAMLCELEKPTMVYSAHREPIRLRLAGRTWYTPDFLVLERGKFGMWGQVVLVEIKGFMRDDAAVKLKVAADLYPNFQFLLVRREGRHGWEVREVTRSGIGREPIEVPWIRGG